MLFLQFYCEFLHFFRFSFSGSVSNVVTEKPTLHTANAVFTKSRFLWNKIVDLISQLIGFNYTQKAKAAESIFLFCQEYCTSENLKWSPSDRSRGIMNVLIKL